MRFILILFLLVGCTPSEPKSDCERVFKRDYADKLDLDETKCRADIKQRYCEESSWTCPRDVEGFCSIIRKEMEKAVIHNCEKMILEEEKEKSKPIDPDEVPATPAPYKLHQPPIPYRNPSTEYV